MAEKKPKPLTPEEIERLRDLATNPHAMSPGAAERFRKWRRSAVIGYLILLVGVAFTYQSSHNTAEHARKAIVASGRTVSVSGCNRDFMTIQGQRVFLQSNYAAIPNFVKKGVITKALGDASAKNIVKQLAATPLPDCRISATLLTDNPNDLPPVPKPLYPGKPLPKQK